MFMILDSCIIGGRIALWECSRFLTHALLVEELPHGLVRPIFLKDGEVYHLGSNCKPILLDLAHFFWGFF
jgi:hypothetical protein